MKNFIALLVMLSSVTNGYVLANGHALADDCLDVSGTYIFETRLVSCSGSDGDPNVPEYTWISGPSGDVILNPRSTFTLVQRKCQRIDVIVNERMELPSPKTLVGDHIPLFDAAQNDATRSANFNRNRIFGSDVHKSSYFGIGMTRKNTSTFRLNGNGSIKATLKYRSCAYGVFCDTDTLTCTYQRK